MSFALFITCIILIAAVLIFTVVTVVVSKIKLKRALKPVEYYPPRGYSPIDVQLKYYSRAANPHALFNPLMLYWAENGFITIEEDCKRGLKLTKLKAIEPNKHAADDVACGRNYRAEKTLFDEMFSRGPVFYTLAAESTYETVHEKFMKSCKSNSKKVNSPLSKKLTIATAISSVAALIIVTLICGLTVRSPLFVAMVFPIVAVVACKFMPNELFLKYPFLAVWGGAPFGAVVGFGPPDCAVLLGCAVAVAFINVNVLSYFIDFRSDEDVAVYGRICAFKTFLLEAESDRLETLVEENPAYFYDVLPYCYILKITDKLKPKFDKITLDGPSWYLGDMRDTLMF